MSIYRPGDIIPSIKCPACKNVTVHIVGPEQRIDRFGETETRTYPSRCSMCKMEFDFHSGPRTFSKRAV